MSSLLKKWKSTSTNTKALCVFVVCALVVAIAGGAMRAGPGRMTPLPLGDIGNDAREQVAAFLDAESILYRLDGREVRVEESQQTRVLASLRARGVIGRDDALASGALGAHKPAWYLSNEQNRQVFDLALQDELSRVVGAYPGVRRATVLISRPRAVGFGATHQRPSASVSVEMMDGELDEYAVDAIAGVVSGAVAEMRTEDVAVIDATAGRQFKSRASSSTLGGGAHELKRTVEQACRRRIVEALAYIEGVIVAVNAEVDVVRKELASDVVEPRSTPESRDHDRMPGRFGSIPGPWLREYEPALNRRTETSVDPGGLPTRIGATVNVPRSYIVEAYRRKTGQSDYKPTDAELSQIANDELERIRRQVEPLVESRDTGRVVVDIYPDGPTLPQVSAVEGGTISPVVPGRTMDHAAMIPWAIVAALVSAILAFYGLRRHRSGDSSVSRIAPFGARAIAERLIALPEDEAARELIELSDEAQAQVLRWIAELSGLNTDRDPDPGGEGGAPIAPEMLDHLNDATIRAVLDEVEAGELQVALRASSERFRDRLLRQLPADDAKQLRRELDTPAPVRVSEIERAHRLIVDVARQYQSVGEVAA